MVIAAVTNFVVLAGGSRRSGFFEKRILPEVASMTTAARALRGWADEAGGEKPPMNRKRAKTQNRICPELRRSIRASTFPLAISAGSQTVQVLRR